MHHQTCSKGELQMEDRVLDRVIAAWGKWWRLTLAILRLDFRTAYCGALSSQLKASKAGKGAAQ